MTTVYEVTCNEWVNAYATARLESTLVREMTSNVMDILDPNVARRYFLTGDERSGYVVNDTTRELLGLFSREIGRGNLLVESAKRNGARRLDCFDGYLPGFYERHGFVETAREDNWTPGEPDVVYMELGTDARRELGE